ncbi:MAG: hypothetical protein ACRD1G_17665, partial [Acidimicrobiales bacterium]
MASPVSAASPGAPTTDTDFLYRLLTHWGASDLTASTIQFFVVRPLEILVILVLAYAIARLGSGIAKRG